MVAFKENYLELDAISPTDFKYFRNKIFELAGISIADSKIELIRTRLRSRVIALQLNSFEEYREYLGTLPKDDAEWQSFINVLTTNKTDWFREPEHFQFLMKDFLPKWLTLGKKNLRLWCAASSTGEEPYTLALVLKDMLKNTKVDFEIIASDIDTKVLEVGRNGVYPVSRLDQIPNDYHEFVVRGTGDISSWFRLKKDLKSKVKFEQVNLVTDNYNHNEKFDLVFCRNVLIYFDAETITKVSQNIFNYCYDDAVLIIGHSESLQNTTGPWVYSRPSIYIKGRTFK